MPISDWPLAERPRERLLAAGPSGLSDAELLAIFLRTGVPGKSALDIARELLSKFTSISRLLALDPAQLRKTPGIGNAKAAQFIAAAELVKRGLNEEIASGSTLSSPQAVRDFLRLSLGRRDHEVFVAMMLDAQHRVIASEELFRGTLTQTSVYPREVVKRALHHNAAAVIFAHNHPSGVAEPSRADETLTTALKQSLQLVDVRVLDHFIVTAGTISSLAERGLL